MSAACERLASPDISLTLSPLTRHTIHENCWLQLDSLHQGHQRKRLNSFTLIKHHPATPQWIHNNFESIPPQRLRFIHHPIPPSVAVPLYQENAGIAIVISTASPLKLVAYNATSAHSRPRKRRPDQQSAHGDARGHIRPQNQATELWRSHRVSVVQKEHRKEGTVVMRIRWFLLRRMAAGAIHGDITQD